MTPKDMQSRLLAIRSEERNPIWEPPPVDPSVPTTTSVLHQLRDPAAIPAELEAGMIAILRGPRLADETHVAAGDRKECELADLLDELDPVVAFHLGRRLDIARASDPLVAAFARLAPERRARARQFIADTRRRAAFRRAA